MSESLLGGRTCNPLLEPTIYVFRNSCRINPARVKTKHFAKLGVMKSGQNMEQALEILANPECDVIPLRRITSLWTKSKFMNKLKQVAKVSRSTFQQGRIFVACIDGEEFDANAPWPDLPSDVLAALGVRSRPSPTDCVEQARAGGGEQGEPQRLQASEDLCSPP